MTIDSPQDEPPFPAFTALQNRGYEPLFDHVLGMQQVYRVSLEAGRTCFDLLGPMIRRSNAIHRIEVKTPDENLTNITQA